MRFAAKCGDVFVDSGAIHRHPRHCCPVPDQQKGMVSCLSSLLSQLNTFRRLVRYKISLCDTNIVGFAKDMYLVACGQGCVLMHHCVNRRWRATSGQSSAASILQTACHSIDCNNSHDASTVQHLILHLPAPCTAR